MVDSKRLNLGHAVSLVIYPRALEDLLRVAGSRLFDPVTAKVIPNGVKVTSEQLTLIDDPHLDGLRYSRGFDDAGCRPGEFPDRERSLDSTFFGGLAITRSRDYLGTGGTEVGQWMPLRRACHPSCSIAAPGFHG